MHSLYYGIINAYVSVNYIQLTQDATLWVAPGSVVRMPYAF